MATGQGMTFEACVSSEEQKQRTLVYVINGFIWLGLAVWTAVTCGTVLLFAGGAWLLRFLLAEFHVRSLEALGATVSPRQFPEVYTAAQEVAQQFNWKVMPRIIVIHSGEANAFAIRFARKRVIVILSDLLEGLIQHPAQLRFLLAHEMCHGALDHGPRGIFEIYKPMAFLQARELTCDNAGIVAAGSLDEATAALKKICVGPRLHHLLVDAALVGDAVRINTGFSGWLVRQHLSHPPIGSRLQNLQRFSPQLQPAFQNQQPPHRVP